MVGEMRNSTPTVTGLILLSASLLAGCSSTSSPSTSSSSSPVQTLTASPRVQTSMTAPEPVISSASPTTSAKTVVATCQTQHLLLTQGLVDGTAGSWYITYYLQNHGPSTCSMVGYPGYSLLFSNGSVIQRPATRNGTALGLGVVGLVHPPSGGLAYSPVQLGPGDRAKFVVRTVDGSIPATGCSTSWKTAEVQVYPPNQTTAIREPSSIAACDLSVGPVSAG